MCCFGGVSKYVHHFFTQETKVLLQSFLFLPLIIAVLLSFFFSFTPWPTWTRREGWPAIPNPFKVKATFKVLFSG